MTNDKLLDTIDEFVQTTLAQCTGNWLRAVANGDKRDESEIYYGQMLVLKVIEKLIKEERCQRKVRV